VLVWPQQRAVEVVDHPVAVGPQDRHLARRGHAVEIRDAGPLPGGMMHFGIPAYRLPRADLMTEIRRIDDDNPHPVAKHQGRL